MEWDNVGLLLGARERPVDTVLTALDLTPGVIEEAVGLGAQVVVTHHPVPPAAPGQPRRQRRYGCHSAGLSRNRHGPSSSSLGV